VRRIKKSNSVTQGKSERKRSDQLEPEEVAKKERIYGISECTPKECITHPQY